MATTLGLHRFGLPATVGFLVTGAIADPHGLGLVGDESHIELIAEIGEILIPFAMGLEFSLVALAMWNPASVAWRSGVYLAQFGEFGYVVLLLGVSVGLISSMELQLVVTTGVVSIVLALLIYDPATIRRAIAATCAESPHVPIMARARYVAERDARPADCRRVVDGKGETFA